MDMQGTPIGSSNQGMKNTSDPERYDAPIEEGAGAVASDSLAAESARAGGSFGANRDSNPLSVKGNQSTFANTDTSNATTLPPAANSQEREGDPMEKYPEGAGGQGNFHGAHSQHGYVGGPTSARDETNTSSSSAGGGGATPSSGNDNSTSTTSGSGNSGDSSVDAAPGYMASVVSAPGKTGKPHGKNITEGGFDSDPSNNASFNSEIGSEQDPGRVAEGQMQLKTQSASGGTGPRQGVGQQGEGTYGVLETEQNL